MDKKSMKKYYIGLMALGLFTIGIAIYVLMMGVQARQDVKTEKAATKAVEKLNSYVSSKQKIPANLKEAGVKDVPSTITYSKLSEEKYKFCVTYKADKGYGSGDITSALTGAATSQMYGDYPAPETPEEETYLYLSYTHKKGEECHTIKPYIYSFDTYNDSSTETDICSPTYKYYQDYKSYCATRNLPVN